MRRNVWKWRRSDSSEQPSAAGKGEDAVTDGLVPAEPSGKGEKQAGAGDRSKRSCAPEKREEAQPEFPAQVRESADDETATQFAAASARESNDGGADDDERYDSVGWTVRLSRGSIINVTDRHVFLSDDCLGFITFDDGESVPLEGIRRLGW